MLASITSCGLSGIDGFTVTAEVNLANGMPMFEIVGLPDASVKESRERVRAALKNSGFSFPNGRITVNLAPADLKKEGPAYDLPIALGLLACSGAIDPEALRDVCVLGELSLDGSVRPVRGMLPMVIHARQSGMKAVMVPGQGRKPCSGSSALMRNSMAWPLGENGARLAQLMGSPEAMRSCSLIMSTPVICSDTGCSTCTRVFISMK